MRDYAKITSAFWNGKTGKQIRGDSAAQLTGLYLLTNSHSNMIGVYYCPVGYIHLDTGLPFEGASKGLQRLIEVGFCQYDEDREMVFVTEMARIQIGESFKPADNRVKDIQKQYDNIPECQLKTEFFHKYEKAFCLVDKSKTTIKSGSPFEAPSKPLQSQEQEQEQEQKQEQEQAQEQKPPKPPVSDAQVSGSPLSVSKIETETQKVGRISKAMVAAGLQNLNQQHPTFTKLIQAGATEEEFVEVTKEAINKGKEKAFAWIVATVMNRREDAAKLNIVEGDFSKNVTNPAEARIFSNGETGFPGIVIADDGRAS